MENSNSHRHLKLSHQEIELIQASLGGASLICSLVPDKAKEFDKLSKEILSGEKDI